ncbi:MAG: DNA-directed RNA polymerase subunit omega [Nitrospinota bacterium]|nr:DNA-directed RNA polymerase subunit omega [Nitrospinota bacterium]MDH5757535.1 DNA-directed RNA polymerase subunit omega [Nitrospinota bacterium]
MFNMDLYREANKKITESFLLSNIVTQRVRQLQEGAEPLVDGEGLSMIDMALMEIAEGKIEARKEEITTREDLFSTVEEEE